MRSVVIYTPNYAVIRYKVVYDSRRRVKRDLKFNDEVEAVKYWQKVRAEDSSIRLFHVASSLTNTQLLNTLNKTIEISTYFNNTHFSKMRIK